MIDLLNPGLPFDTHEAKLAIASAHKEAVELIVSSDLNQTERLIFLIAESSKDEESRKIFANSEIFAPLADALSHPDSPDTLKLQVLRAFGDHLYDTENAVLGMVACLKSSCKNPELLHCCLASLLNVSMDNEPIESEIVEKGGMEALLSIIKSKSQAVFMNGRKEEYDDAFLSLQLLSSIVECERGPTALVEKREGSTGLVVIFELIRLVHGRVQLAALSDDDFDQALEFLDALVVLIESVSEKEEIQRAVFTDGFFSSLLDFVDHKLPQSRNISALSIDSDTGKSVTPDEGGSNYKDIRKMVSKITTAITMNDDNMRDLAGQDEIIARLVRWMELGDGGREEDDIRMAGALCIGNIARSGIWSLLIVDETCKELVKRHGVVPGLLKLLKEEMDRLVSANIDVTGLSEAERKEAKDELKSIIQVLHAVIGTLKNLSLAVSVREELGAGNLVDLVAEFLGKEGVKVIQFGAIGILKNICQDNGIKLHVIIIVPVDRNTYRIITGNEMHDPRLAEAEPSYGVPLQSLVKFLWKAVEDNDTGIRSEGGRCIANLVRCCHQARSMSSSLLILGPGFIKVIIHAQGVPILVQIVTGATLTLAQEATDDSEDRSVSFDAVPNEANVFPIVLNEGVVALMIMCTAFPETALDIVKFEASLIPTFARVVITSESEEKVEEAAKTQVYADEIKANVCVLMETLARADPGFKIRVIKECGGVLKEVLARVGGGVKSRKIMGKGKTGIPFGEALARLVEVLA